jgi:sulfatase maturation enzyme AslB (radical SAM superfamily)
MRQPTIEWQVCGHCNYDCSYCIQSKSARVGHPSPEEVAQFLAFFEATAWPLGDQDDGRRAVLLP